MENDVQFIPYCCDVLYQFHRSEGRIDQASKYYGLAVKFMETYDDVKEECINRSI